MPREAGEPAGHAAGDDAYLVRRIRLWQHEAYEGVTGLVVGDDLALPLADDAALALRPGDDAVHGLVELRHRYLLLAATGGEDRRLVHKVGEVGAGEAGGLLGQRLHVDAAVQRLALGVDLQDRFAPLNIRAGPSHPGAGAA